MNFFEIYEINEQIADLIAASVDEETGEVNMDMEAFEALQIARDDILENIALWIKNRRAEADAIKAEEKKLAERRKALENRTERWEEILKSQLAGEKMKTPRVVISYRTSTAVEIDPAAFFCDANAGYFRVKEPEADKKAIADAIKAGQEIAGATLCERTSMQIK